MDQVTFGQQAERLAEAVEACKREFWKAVEEQGMIPRIVLYMAFAYAWVAAKLNRSRS